MEYEENRRNLEADSLIRDNMRLVLKIANDFLGRGLPWDDLVSEGNRGLVTAAHRFDPEKGRKVNIVWKEGKCFRVNDHWEYKDGGSPLEKCIEITHDLSKAMDLCHQWSVENFTEEEIGCICTNNQYEAELEEEWVQDRLKLYGMTGKEEKKP